MATVRDIITRALVRSGITAIGRTPMANQTASALDALNDMMRGWPGDGVDALLTTDWALADTFKFWVPPAELTAEVIDVLADQGAWNASTNTPTLASSAGTKGYYYKVSVAGSTTLDDVTSWAVGDYAVFNGEEWLRSIDSRRHDGDVIAMLAKRMMAEFGQAANDHQSTLMDASRGWRRIQAAYIKPPNAQFEKSLRYMPHSAALDVDEVLT